MIVPPLRDSIYDNIPVADPPPGELTNLEDPPSLATAVICVSGLTAICMLFFVACRFWNRAVVTKKFKVDDWICGIATLCSIAHITIILYDINVKLGVHLWDIPASVFLNAANIRLLTSVSLIYSITILFVKASILLLYSRCFKDDQNLQRTIFVVLAFLALYYTAYISVQIAIVVQCTGPAMLGTNVVCTSSYSINVFQSSISVLTDMLILFLPTRNIWLLHCSNGCKIGLWILLAGGSCVCSIAIARLTFLAITLPLNDPWNSAIVAILSIIEVNLAIILSSAVVLPRLSRTSIIIDRKDSSSVEKIVKDNKFYLERDNVAIQSIQSPVRSPIKHKAKLQLPSVVSPISTSWI